MTLKYPLTYFNFDSLAFSAGLQAPLEFQQKFKFNTHICNQACGFDLS
jgi:hypothetical protein